IVLPSAVADTTTKWRPCRAIPADEFGSRSCLKVVCCSVRRSCLGLRLPGPPAACNVSAPTDAACGAAALVPKKLGKVSASCAASETKKVVFAPSMAARSGLARTSGRRSGLFCLSKYEVDGPGEVNASGMNGGKNAYAATLVAPRAELWPKVIGPL